MRETRTAGRMEFHVARAARDLYGFDQALFSSTGNVVFADFHAARLFAARMNERRDLVRFPERAVSAGQLNALGLVDEMLHVLLERYRQDVNPRVMTDALARLDGELGPDAVDATLNAFLNEFPPVAVYRREADPDAYLAGSSDGRPNREVALEELLMLWLGNLNPACAPFSELLDDERLDRSSEYARLTRILGNALDGAFGFGGPVDPVGAAVGPGPVVTAGSLLAALRAPALASPRSLTGQLQFLLERYGGLLGKYYYRLLTSLDLIAEEEKLVFVGPAGPGGGGEAHGPGLGADEELENFTADREWMPRLVLIAKNAFVWLDQLSRKHGRTIDRLDLIPDEELDALARAGIGGLWLIGLWERSRASREIKQRMGNQDAVASAYSVYDYVIAPDLGGEDACEGLRRKAAARGIRLASDMVPNHVGIDGRWVIERPDWFVRQPHSPFPSYRFESQDLSTDPRVGIFLEDHYYDRSDAAVVFKRVDKLTGETWFIFHGNDGTSMPWNDTAQLDYLNPELREVVIQTILHVARQFPVIRFDAAMTLAKKHVQRLWYPEPGTGGAIASRADHAMPRAEFDRRMPVEFWREVVDRVAREAPDTLLLAEAFWMMEGYFVRTLGMHRVYNSAFMHMLRDEQNAEYRAIIKETLAFEPEILKRFVNFMNNPDERTAVDQFGSGDKYFAVCTLMATLPGLPMFGHGQIEGFGEKYGMEYRRAYRDERPDENLVARHERQVFPLLHRRQVFAGVESFRLYDLAGEDGRACEDVFAYSNGAGGDRALVIVHNRFASASGWIRDSVPFSTRGPGAERREGRQSLAQTLGLSDDPAAFAAFRDQVSGLEFLRSARDLHERGLLVELGAYQHHVFLDWRELRDQDGRPYAHLCGLLNGRGVPSLEEALRELTLGPVTGPFRDIAGPAAARRLAQGDPALPAEVAAAVGRLAAGAAAVAGATGDADGLARAVEREIVSALPAAAPLGEPLPSELLDAAITLGWIAAHRLGELDGLAGPAAHARSRSLIDEWRLGRVLGSTLEQLGLDEVAAARGVALVKLLVEHQAVLGSSLSSPARAFEIVQEWLGDPEVQAFLGVNRYRGVLWFGREPFEQLLAAVARLAALQPAAPAGAWADLTRELREAGAASGYRVDALVEIVTAAAAGPQPGRRAGGR